MDGRCRSCAHFRNDPDYLETVFKGLSSLSSARGSVRADDGICAHHDRYIGAEASCADYAARPASTDGTALAGARVSSRFQR